MSLAPPRSRRPPFLAVLAALLVVVTGLACDDGSNSPSGTGPLTDQQVVVRLVSGTSLRGLSLDMRHGTGFTVTAVQSLGPLASASCDSNPESGRLRVACVAFVDFDAPFDAWLITFNGPELSSPLEVITDVTCTGSDATGATSVLVCDLST